MDSTSGSHKDLYAAQEIQINFLERIDFFIEILQKLKEIHVSAFRNLLFNQNFKTALLWIISKSEIKCRLKCHEILEHLSTYFMTYCASRSIYEIADDEAAEKEMMSDHVLTYEVDIISQDWLALTQLYVKVVRLSFENSNDSYMEFSSLILLDNIFQNLMPVPSYPNELLKIQWNQGH